MKQTKTWDEINSKRLGKSSKVILYPVTCESIQQKKRLQELIKELKPFMGEEPAKGGKNPRYCLKSATIIDIALSELLARKRKWYYDY